MAAKKSPASRTTRKSPKGRRLSSSKRKALAPAKPTILVTGDIIVDHHLYEGRRHYYADARNPGVTSCEAPGGATLIHQLLRHEDGGDGAGNGCLLPPLWKSHQAVKPPVKPSEGHVAYAFWRPRPGQKKEHYWRVAEAMVFGSAKDTSSCPAWPRASNLPTKPRIIALSDGGMGFRKNEACWKNLPFGTATWIVCKTELPDFDGPLWKSLSKHWRKVVVVISAAELRKGEARISAGLSWEATLQDLWRELAHGTLKRLPAACAHLVITFDTEAALWIDFSMLPSANKQQPQAHFVFYAPAVEGDRRREVDGTAFGLTSCLAAGVVWSLTEAVDKLAPPSLTEGIEGGLSAMRDLLERGHGPADEDASRPTGFPAARLAEVIKSPRHLFSRSYFSWVESITEASWILLRQAAPDMAARARLVATHGDIALHNVPHIKIGNLFTADRDEIERLRTLIQTIMRYKEPTEKGKKPLSHSSHSNSPHDHSHWYWTFILVVIVVGMGCGTWGYVIYEPEGGAHGAQAATHATPLASAMYHALQMFLLHMPHLEGRINWPLEIGRWSAALATGLTGLLFLHSGMLFEWRYLWFKLWDGKLGQCLEVVSGEVVGKNALNGSTRVQTPRSPGSVSGDWFTSTEGRSASLRRKTIPSALAIWNANSDSQSP